MAAVIDAHVAFGAGNTFGNVVTQYVGVDDRGARGARILALQPHIAGDIDDLAAGLNVGRVAEQHPTLAARRVIIHAHVVQRPLVAMVNLSDAGSMRMLGAPETS